MTTNQGSPEIAKLEREADSLKEKLKAETRTRDAAKLAFEKEQKELEDLKKKMQAQQEKVRTTQIALHTEEQKWQATNSLLSQKETELAHKRAQFAMGSQAKSDMRGLH